MTVKKKIYYFSPFALSENVAASIRAKYIIEELSKSAEVELIYGYKNPDLLFSIKNNEAGNISRLSAEILVGLELSLKILFKKSDLYILSSPSFITVLMLGITLRLLKREYVLDIRDIYPEVYFNLKVLNEDGIIGKLLKAATRSLYKGAQKIVCVTEGLKKIIESYSEQLKVEIVYNGYDEKLFYPDKKFDKFTVIFHGNLGKLQNIELLVSVANRLPGDMEIKVAGDGPGKKLLENCSRIIYLGPISNKNVAEIVRKSHVGISFRMDGVLNETAIPVKVFEYIGAGIPVILTPKSEAGEYIEKNKYGKQFNNSEIDEIVKMVVDIKSNYFEYKVDREFSRLNQSEKFFKILKTTK